MRKNAHFKLQVRTRLNSGHWLGWDDVKSQESSYQEEQPVPKKAAISDWFRMVYSPTEKIKAVWQAGLYWGCLNEENGVCEYRVVHRKDESEVKL